MSGRPELEIPILESLEEVAPTAEEREAAAAVEAAETGDLLVGPTDAPEVHEAIRARQGASSVLARLPQLDRPEAWLSTAYFSICERSGTASDLRLGGEPAASIYPDGKVLLAGYDPSIPGKVSCSFEAPATARYTFGARLKGWHPWGGTFVESFIDGQSFGQVEIPYAGGVQPYVAYLGSGNHTFRVQHARLPFWFLSLTVWALPEVIEA